MKKVIYFKLYLILFLLLGLLMSCSQENSKNTDNNCTEENIKEAFIKHWSKEVLERHKMFLNGKNLYKLTTDSLIQVLGKPDTIYYDVPTFYSNINVKSNYWIYGNSIFNEKNGKCTMIHLDFNTTDIEIESPYITLKKDLSIKEIVDIFPYSISRIQNPGNLWSDSIEIYGTSNGDNTRWLLTFRAEKLYKITYITGLR